MALLHHMRSSDLLGATTGRFTATDVGYNRRRFMGLLAPVNLQLINAFWFSGSYGSDSLTSNQLQLNKCTKDAEDHPGY